MNESFLELCLIMLVFRVKQSSLYCVNHLITPFFCYTFNILTLVSPLPPSDQDWSLKLRKPCPSFFKCQQTHFQAENPFKWRRYLILLCWQNLKSPRAEPSCFTSLRAAPLLFISPALLTQPARRSSQCRWQDKKRRRQCGGEWMRRGSGEWKGWRVW